MPVPTAVLIAGIFLWLVGVLVVLGLLYASAESQDSTHQSKTQTGQGN